MLHLVDTSVWIDFLRGRENPKSKFLANLLGTGDVAINSVVFSEICWGAVNAKQQQKYRQEFQKLPFLHLPDDWHLTLATMGHQLRLSGHKPFLADLCITLTALHHDVPLLTNDHDFESHHRAFGLNLV